MGVRVCGLSCVLSDVRCYACVLREICPIAERVVEGWGEGRMEDGCVTFDLWLGMRFESCR